MSAQPPAPLLPRSRAPARRRASGAQAHTSKLTHLHTALWPHLLLGLVFLLLYSLTLQPGLLPADAGEYQLTGALLGVAHPPGFALYTLLSWLISRVPGVSPATAINWLSALLAAGALALVSRAGARQWSSPLAGLAGAALLGLSTTFWAQATTANIRMPAAFATAWALERLVNYRQTVLQFNLPDGPTPSAAPPGSLRAEIALAWLAFALGLGVAHHASLVFAAGVLGLYALWLRPAALRRPWPLLAGVVPFLAWLYLPLRAGAFGAPPGIATVPGFLEHILALGFRGDLFHFANLAALPQRLAILVNILRFEFHGPALLLMALGVLAAWRRSRSFGLALLLAAAVHAFVAITYRAPQTVEYLLPAYVLMALWASAGVAALAGAAQSAGQPRRMRPALLLAAALFTAWVLGGQWQATAPSYRQLAREDGTRAYAEAVLTQAPSEAVILSTWHWATPLWYLQKVEGQRPDVEVRYVFPRGESLAQNWVAEIEAELPARPVLVTSFYPEYRALPYRFVPLGPAWEVRDGPLLAPPPDLTGAQPGQALNFLGYHISHSDEAGVALIAAWQPTSHAPEDVSFFVHLLGPDGSLHSQQDVPYTATAYRPGEVLLDRYTLPLAPNAAPGIYRLVAGAYRPTAPAARLAEVTLQTIAVAGPASLTPPVPPGAVPLGSAMWLESAEILPDGPLRPGDALTVRLRFLAARPLTVDYAVSVTAVGPGFSWQAQSDGTPAGGAIPTLKWIAGSRVTDTHTLMIPPDTTPGLVQIRLAVYDSFTLQPLPVLDPERGGSQALLIGEVEVVDR